MLLEKAQRTQIMSFPRSKMNRNVIFGMQILFKNMTCYKTFKSKCDAWLLFFENLTRQKTFIQKFTNCEFFLQNLSFILSFRFWLNDDNFCHWHPNPYHPIIQCQNLPCPNTLLRFIRACYLSEWLPILTPSWNVSNLITLFR